MFTLRMYEADMVVGNPDATVMREYVLNTFDTLSHAVSVSDETEGTIAQDTDALRGWSHTITGAHGTRTEYFHTVVARGKPHDYGNVIRRTWLQISITD